MFARRLQIQERLTEEIAKAIKDAIDPMGVAVVIHAEHMCMSLRGVQKVGCTTMTSALLGVFQTNSKTRSEFFAQLSVKN